MIDASYFIFNVPGNSGRDFCASQIKESMKDFKYLNSQTISLKTLDDCKDFINTNSGFKINIIKDYTGPNTIFPPRAGVIAIIASNYVAWKNFLNTDSEYLILFEDDVIVSKNINMFIDLYLKELPDDWDVFSFYIPDDIKHLYNPEVHDIPGNKYVCKSYTTHCCAAYIINRKAIIKALKDIEDNGISAPIDWYVLNVKHLGNEKDLFNVYCLKPNIYLPVKEVPEVYDNSSLHYGQTEEFKNIENLNIDTVINNDTLIKQFIEIQKILKTNLTIEVGAFEASFSKSMIGLIPDGNIWAFEASPYVYNNFYPIQGINYINKAVSDNDGKIKFEIQSSFNRVIGNNSIMNRNETQDYEYIEVESICLDNMFKDYKNISLWIDCEGASKHVLLGAKNILNNVLSIFIEVEQVEFWKDQWLFSDVYSFLIDNGFILFKQDREFGSNQFNCIFIKKELEDILKNVNV